MQNGASMKILYVGNHNQPNSNDDEGAIAYSLGKVLGHAVVTAGEDIPQEQILSLAGQFDLVLFHKWADFDTIAKIKTRKAFWYFDLVDYDDPEILHRCRLRMAWMDRMMPLVDIGFCTDGDWVRANACHGKLVRLTQGADERFTGLRLTNSLKRKILFTGIKDGGVGRREFVDFLKATYGPALRWIRNGTHQESLAQEIADASIVAAPDHPTTDDYWSNRVYLTLGFGGFLMHPYCGTLANHYVDGKEIVLYRGHDDFKNKASHYMGQPELREAIAKAGLRRTLKEHTYTHRCQTLIEMVQNAKTYNG